MRRDATQPPFWTANRIIPIAGMIMVLLFACPHWGPPDTERHPDCLLAGLANHERMAGGTTLGVNISMVAGALGWWQVFPSKLTLEPAVGLLLVDGPKITRGTQSKRRQRTDLQWFHTRGVSISLINPFG